LQSAGNNQKESMVYGELVSLLYVPLSSWLQLAGGGVDVEQLHGIAACQTDDVVSHNWHSK